MNIRTATEADAPALQRFAVGLFAECLPGIYRREAPTLEEEIAFIRERTRPANSTLLMAEVDGLVVGVVDFVGGTHEQEAHTGIMGISVAHGFRGAGVGTKLIEALLEWAVSVGISRVELHAFASNPRALELYRRLGFEDEGCLRNAVMEDGELVDVFVLAKLLVV